MNREREEGVKLTNAGAISGGLRLFGALLLAFELRTEKIDVVLRTNFGFMYGNKTRTLFLVL